MSTAIQRIVAESFEKPIAESQAQTAKATGEYYLRVVRAVYGMDGWDGNLFSVEEPCRAAQHENVAEIARVMEEFITNELKTISEGGGRQLLAAYRRVVTAGASVYLRFMKMWPMDEDKTTPKAEEKLTAYDMLAIVVLFLILRLNEDCAKFFTRVPTYNLVIGQ
jgi:hypothetical protein